MKDLMYDLVEFFVNVDYSHLPRNVVYKVKSALLDTIAVTIAGSSADGCAEVVDLVRELGGKTEASIPIYGGKAPATLVALATGPMTRAHDLGDIHWGAAHVSEFVIPAVLPMVERVKGTGKQLITAIAVGEEILSRIGKTVLPFNGGVVESHRGPMYAIWGPTAAVAKLAGLDEEKAINAMGIAYAQASGERQCWGDGALTGPVYSGFVAEAAIKSVLLAEKGITGAKNILMGGYGGFYIGFEPKHDTKDLVTDLGQRWELLDIGVKPYPSCAGTHTAIYAVIMLCQENSISPVDIEEIEVGITPYCWGMVCEPLDIKLNPLTPRLCMFSLPYTVATAATKGDVFLEHFTPHSIMDKETRSMLSKIRVKPAPELETSGGGNHSARVRIKTSGGTDYVKQIDNAPGHPKHPFTWEDLVRKLNRCLPYSARPFKEKQVGELIEVVKHLEEVEDASQLVRLLIP